MPKTKSRFEGLISEIYAAGLCKNNQQVCIDCLKPRLRKNKFESKNCGCTNFYVFNYQNSSFKIFSSWCCIKMKVLSKIKPHSDAVDYFKKFPLYNKPIEKPKAKRLKIIDTLIELPFYEQLSVIKTDQVFSGYAMSYKVRIIERKGPIVQLEASKSCIKYLFSDL